jgi:hypothetical protein
MTSLKSVIQSTAWGVDVIQRQARSWDLRIALVLDARGVQINVF